MHNPSSAGREVTRDSDQATPPSRARHAACALASFGVVTLFALVFTSLLFELSQQFGMLSTTALMFGLAALWVLVWTSVESLWEWGAGRSFP